MSETHNEATTNHNISLEILSCQISDKKLYKIKVLQQKGVLQIVGNKDGEENERKKNIQKLHQASEMIEILFSCFFLDEARRAFDQNVYFFFHSPLYRRAA